MVTLMMLVASSYHVCTAELIELRIRARAADFALAIASDPASIRKDNVRNTRAYVRAMREMHEAEDRYYECMEWGPR